VARRPFSQTAVTGIAVALFTVCSLLPVGYLLIQALGSADTNYAALFLDVRQRGLLWNTAVLGVGTASLASAIGVPLGVVLARIALAGKALFRLALVIPLLLPPYVVALAWIYFAGSRGLVASVAGRDLLSEWIYSLPAAVLVLSLTFYPLSMLATEVAVRTIDGRLEEAALLVAPAGRVLRRITLPLAAPGILAAALVILVLAVAEFGVPGLLRVRVYTTEVFTAFAAFYDFKRAVLLALPLLAVCFVVAMAAAALLGGRLVGTARGSRAISAFLDEWRLPGWWFTSIVVAVAFVMPFVVLAREALRSGSISAILSGSGPAIANSLVLATIGATAVVVLAVWLGYARARARGYAGRLADALFVAAFAIPSTVVGVGLIGLWNRPGIMGSVYGSAAMPVLGYLARFVPVAALLIAATTRYVPVSHEEAAAVSGAGWLRTMTRIVLPQIRPGLLAAWVVVFVLACGELGVSILIAPPGQETLPIRIYTMIANAPAAHVASLALLQATITLTSLGVLAAVVSLRGAR